MSLSSVRVHLQLMQSQNWLLWQRSLHPRSRLCLHWIASPRKPTPRIKQRVASCHTAKVMSIQSLPAPPPHIKGTADLRSGWGPPPCLVWTYSHSHDLTLFNSVKSCNSGYCFRFPDFPRVREWRSSKSRFWVPKSAKMGGFRP